MNLFEFFVLVLAAFSLSVIVFFLFRILYPRTADVLETRGSAITWPWSITSYNYWPYWMNRGDSDRGHVVHPSGHPKEDYPRPWGGAQRGANGGAGHHA